MNATRMLTIAVIAFSIQAYAGGVDSWRWPKIDKESAYPWPKTKEDLDILNSRFNQAPREVKGSPEDIFKICDAIHKYPKEPSANVKEIRWLSPNTVIVSAGWYSSPVAAADYYYVLKRVKNKWQIIACYMLMIS